jgi:hypothetical protein
VGRRQPPAPPPAAPRGGLRGSCADSSSSLSGPSRPASMTHPVASEFHPPMCRHRCQPEHPGCGWLGSGISQRVRPSRPHPHRSSLRTQHPPAGTRMIERIGCFGRLNLGWGRRSRIP